MNVKKKNELIRVRSNNGPRNCPKILIYCDSNGHVFFSCWSFKRSSITIELSIHEGE